jgi:sulfur carrier protein
MIAGLLMGSAVAVGVWSGPSHPAPRVVGSAPMSTRIDVVVNGQPRALSAGTTVAALIAELGLAGRRVAVERNREVIPRAQHETAVLGPGDRIEIVTFVGGG